MNPNLIIGEGFVPQPVMFSTAVDHDASVRTGLGGSGLGEGLINEGLWPWLSWASPPAIHAGDRRRRTWQSQICAGVMVILSVVGKSWSWSMKLRHRYRLTSECSLCSGNEKRSKNRRTMGRVSERSYSTILVFPRKEQVHQLIVYQGLTKIPKSKASWFIVDVNIQMVFLSWLE